MNKLRPHNLLINPSRGTVPLAVHHGELITTYRDSDQKYPHTGVATLRYDPTLNTKYNDWWLISDTCEGITDYYRRQIEQWLGIVLLKPAFGAHISIIVGEEPPNKHLWKLDQGRQVEYQYTHDVFTNGEFWWLNVISGEMDAIREYFGLPEKQHQLHLTIGRMNKTDMRLL